MLVTKPSVLVIFGPSGAGKSTLLKRLLLDFKNSLSFSVSHTTRKPRPGERDGVDYHFVSREVMQREIAAQAFIEHVQFSGNLYGTSYKSVNDITTRNKLCVLDLEVCGVKLVKASSLNPLSNYLFIRPPSYEILEERLRKRGTETEKDLQERLATVRDTLAYGDDPRNRDYVVVNDDVEHAYTELKGVVGKLIAGPGV
eukprot:comp8931_c0_seq1/m.4126 comp8931_c0_seq1/g.4126  ORF comp8931_c0_seq1/g.4126 comp8931_c0_seq1/m.4126 type:complete len:199 (-) comp8931_c0_seq1:163-759(-)